MSFDQIQSLAPVLGRIDDLQARVDYLKQLHPDAYARSMEAWAVESTYNSNNIEGSTLSLGETALVYEGIPVNAPADDVRQAEGGFSALKFLQESMTSNAELDEHLLKRAHELVFAEAVDPSTRGSYRTVEVEITGTDFQPCPAAYVAERLSQLIASCARSKRHAVVVASLFHLEFESIHPFVNANGRTGRLMSNFILMRAGYEPVNIQAESRARYIGAIRAFQLEDDPYPLVALFATNLLERLEKLESQLTGGTRRDDAASVSPLVSYLEAEEDSD